MDPIWRENKYRQKLLDIARLRGATHIAIVDADEVLTGNLLQGLRNEILPQIPAGSTLKVPMPCMTGAYNQYRDDESIWAKSTAAVLFADRPNLTWNSPNGYDIHHREPYNSDQTLYLNPGFGGMMHLQFAYRRRLVAKHALYKMTEVIRWPEKSVEEIDALYSQAPDWSDMKTSTAPEDWWAPYQHLLQYLDLHHVPWHEAECRKLIEQYGSERFSGLDLFGVI